MYGYTQFPNERYLILGYFSIPEWYSYTKSINSYTSNTKINLLADTINLCAFRQSNYIANIDNRLLDLVLSNIEITVKRETSLVNIDSFHPPLLIEMKKLSQLNNMSPSYSFHDFRYADYKIINTAINDIDCITELNTDTINGSVDKFYLIVNRIIQNNV